MTQISEEVLACECGHPLQRIKMCDLQKQVPAYGQGAFCNHCFDTGLKDPEIYLHHCNLCQYDVCEACFMLSQKPELKQCRHQTLNLMPLTVDRKSVV
jgi:hypothetical protein